MVTTKNLKWLMSDEIMLLCTNEEVSLAVTAALINTFSLEQAHFNTSGLSKFFFFIF